MTEVRSTNWSESDIGSIRSQLFRILRSERFSRSDRRRQLLDFIVNETLAGRGEQLKGYTIGLEVFGKPPSFDPIADAIVRVEAGRLRNNLRRYYRDIGQFDPVYIDLPRGAYAPQFVLRRPAKPDSSQAATPDDTFGDSVQGQSESLLDLRGRPTVAVLPLVNLSSNPEHGYFADGLTDDLISSLSRISGLFVISRHASFAYRGTDKSTAEIAAAFRVRYLVDGSVRRVGHHVRICVSLIDTQLDRCLWTERYDRDVNDIFAVQDDLARSIVQALKVKLSPVEADRLGHEGTRSVEAHDALLRGLGQFWIYTRVSLAEAQKHFHRALELDPDFALAHAWLARTYVFQYGINWVPDFSKTMEPALQHVRRAIELDDQLAFAHAIMGWVMLFYRDGESAIAAGRRACALDPNNADARLFLSLSLAACGHGEEAMRYIEAGMRLHPHPSSFYLYALGKCLFALGRYEEAIEAQRRGIEVNVHFIPNHYDLAITLGVCGRVEEARAEAAIVRADWPEVSKIFFLDPGLAAEYERGKKVAGLA